MCCKPNLGVKAKNQGQKGQMLWTGVFVYQDLALVTVILSS